MSRARGKGLNTGWAWLLVAAVLLLRAAVPQGFMPERSDSGAVSLTVCGSGGLVHIPVDEEPGKPAPTSHCAFAGLGSPADLPVQPVLPARAWSAPEYSDQREAAQRAAALYPRPPSRGPPTLA